MSAADRFNEQVRKLAQEEARRVSPGTRKYVVIKAKPLLLEALHSDIRLSDEDDNFEATREVRQHAKAGDVVIVNIEEGGDCIAVGVQRSAKEVAAERKAEEEAAGP